VKYIDIAFDLDGVLIDIMPAFNRIIWEEYQSIQIPHNNWNIATDPYLDEDTIMECIVKAMHCLDEIRIMPGATELLYKLHEMSGEPVKIITARSPKTVANVTYRLISERLCDFPYDLTLVSEHSKVPYLNRYGFMVEDRRKNALEFANADKKVYIIDAYYNQGFEHPLVKRISGVHELIPHVEEFIREV
jgi:hypothetical protein